MARVHLWRIRSGGEGVYSYVTRMGRHMHIQRNKFGSDRERPGAKTFGLLILNGIDLKPKILGAPGMKWSDQGRPGRTGIEIQIWLRTKIHLFCVESNSKSVPGRGPARKTGHTHPGGRDTPRSMPSIEIFLNKLTNGLARRRLARIRSGGEGVYSYVTRTSELLLLPATNA